MCQGSVTLSANLRSSYPSLFGPGVPASHALTVAPVQLVPLTGVFLQAQDERSYIWSEDRDNLDALVYGCKGQRVYRQGELVRARHTAAFRIVMMEPVLQGLVSRDSTQVIVMPPSGASASSSLQNGYLEEPLREDSRSGTTSYSYDVAEDFLAASLLDGLDGEPIPNSLPTRSTSDLANALEESGFTRRNETGRATDRGRTLQATALQERPNAATLQPRPPSDEDDHIQAFVRTSDLGRLGLISGDHVSDPCTTGVSGCALVSRTLTGSYGAPQVEVSSSHNPPDHRVLRLYGNDSALSHLPASTSIPMALSPITLHNMGSPKTISLRFAVQRPGEAFFPTADAVTIARVASEHSMHKRYQPIFLEGLKAFFQEKRRILKQGDLIAIPIDDALARFTEDVPEGQESAAAGGDSDAEPFEWVNPSILSRLSVA